MRKHLWRLALLSCAAGAACNDPVKVDDVKECEPEGTTSATCSEEEGVLCVLVTATEDAVSELTDGGWDDFADAALNLSFEIETTLFDSGLDCSTDARYDLVVVDPDEIRKDGEPVTDALLATGAGSNAYDVVFDNLESLTDLSAVQQALHADAVLVMIGKAIPATTEDADGSFTSGRAEHIAKGDGVSDNELRKWAVYYWASDTSGPHELGHLLGAQHDPSADDSCGTLSFDYNCGFADDDSDLGTIMAYRSGCDGTCERQYMFSNPHRSPPDHPGVTLGDDQSYNACAVYNLWTYTSLTSNLYEGTLTPADAAIDPTLYAVETCPAL